MLLLHKAQTWLITLSVVKRQSAPPSTVDQLLLEMQISLSILHSLHVHFPCPRTPKHKKEKHPDGSHPNYGHSTSPPASTIFRRSNPHGEVSSEKKLGSVVGMIAFLARYQ